MVVTPELRAQILRLYLAEHWRIGTIARQLHLHRDTVRRVLAVSSVLREPAVAPVKLIDPFIAIPSRDAGEVSNTGGQSAVRHGSRTWVRGRQLALPPSGGATASPRRSRGVLAASHPCR